VARKQPWSELSTTQKASILGLVAVQAILVGSAQRDLSSRADGQTRGPKLLWRVLTMNTVGALLYFAVGRPSAA
jgi:hypothetical protein